MKFSGAYSHNSIHLHDAQIYDAGEQCPICGNAQYRQPAVELQKDPLIQLLYCQTCHGLSASYMPKEEVLDSFYRQYYSGDTEPNITFHNPVRFARHFQKLIPNGLSLVEPMSILDYGGGDGTLSKEIAHLLKPGKVHITVVDNEESGLVGSETVILKKVSNLDDLEREYDIVLASAIIEHIPEPADIVRNLFSLLKPGGLFYARTPWTVPLTRILNIDLGYPGHVHDLGAAFWNRSPQTFGLNAEVIVSQPSIVATTFPKAFLRTLAAHILKFPALVECKLIKGRSEPLWKYVGGWEVLLRKRQGT